MGQAYTERCARYVDSAIQEAHVRGHVAEPHKAAILAAMQITDRLFRAHADAEELQRELGERVTEMRAGGMQIERIAEVCGISGRTVARILSRKGPSSADVGIVDQHDTEAEVAAAARENDQELTLKAIGIKLRSPLPVLRPEFPGSARTPIYWSAE